MRIYIDRDYVKVKLTIVRLGIDVLTVMSFNCLLDLDELQRQLKGCIDKGWIDKYDYQRIIIFILQNRRTIGAC